MKRRVVEAMPRRVQLAPVSGKVSELVDVFCKITGVPKGVESTVPQRDFQDRNASGDLEGPCGPCVDGRLFKPWTSS